MNKNKIYQPLYVDEAESEVPPLLSHWQRSQPMTTQRMRDWHARRPISAGITALER